MIQELIYTSAPHGLKPGSRGFCTVATTPNLPRNLLERLESLSGYHHLFPVGDPRASQNPISFVHVRLTIAGKPHHILSRVADAGLDYTQRSNKLAHHLVLDAKELQEEGPAAMLAEPGIMQTAWKGEPRLLDVRGSVPANRRRQGHCAAWQRVAGDSGWAGLMASSIGSPDRAVVLIYPLGTNVLELIQEALGLLPANARWQVTFNTYFTRLAPGIECRWRCVVADTPEAKLARADRQALVIDLPRLKGKPPNTALVEYARTGSRTAAVDAQLRELLTVQKTGESSGFGLEFIPVAKAVQSRSHAGTASELDALDVPVRKRKPPVKSGLQSKTIALGVAAVAAVLILSGLVVKSLLPSHSAPTPQASQPDAASVAQLRQLQAQDAERRAIQKKIEEQQIDLHNDFLQVTDALTRLQARAMAQLGKIASALEKPGENSPDETRAWKQDAERLREEFDKERDKFKNTKDRVKQAESLLPERLTTNAQGQIKKDVTSSEKWDLEVTRLQSDLASIRQYLEQLAKLQQSIAAAKPAAPEVPLQPVDGPLLQLQRFVELETRGSASAEPKKLGKIFAVPDTVEINLLGGKYAEPSLRLVKSEPPQKAACSWSFRRTEDDKQIASLILERGSLMFHWDVSAPQDVNPLKWSMLQVRAPGGQVFWVQFVSPTNEKQLQKSAKVPVPEHAFRELPMLARLRIELPEKVSANDATILLAFSDHQRSDVKGKITFELEEPVDKRPMTATARIAFRVAGVRTAMSLSVKVSLDNCNMIVERSEPESVHDLKKLKDEAHSLLSALDDPGRKSRRPKSDSAKEDDYVSTLELFADAHPWIPRLTPENYREVERALDKEMADGFAAAVRAIKKAMTLTVELCSRESAEGDEPAKAPTVCFSRLTTSKASEETAKEPSSGDSTKSPKPKKKDDG